MMKTGTFAAVALAAFLFVGTLQTARAQVKIISATPPLLTSTASQTNDVLRRFDFATGPHNDFTEAASIIIGLDVPTDNTDLKNNLISRINQMHWSDKQALIGTLQSGVAGAHDAVFARLVLAILYAQLDQPQKAYATITEILSISMGDSQAVDQLNWAVSVPSMKEFLSEIQKQREEPQNAGNHAVDLANQGKKDEALALARVLLQKWPKSMPAMGGAAYSFARFEQWNEAATCQEHFLAGWNGDSNYYGFCTLAEYYMKAGRFTEALQRYNKTLATATDKSIKWFCHAGIVQTYIGMNKYDDAAKALVDVDLNATDIFVSLRIIDIRNNGDFNKQSMIASLERALPGKKGVSAPEYLLGVLYLDMGRTYSAREIFQKISDDPQASGFILRRVVLLCLSTDGMHEFGFSIAEKYYAANSSDQGMFLAIAQAYHTLGNSKKAAVLAKKIVDKPSKDMALMSDAADFLDQLGQWDYAIRARKIVLGASNPPQEYAMNMLAHTYTKAGRLADASEIYKRLLSFSGYAAGSLAELWNIGCTNSSLGLDPAVEARALIEADKCNNNFEQRVLADICNSNATPEKANFYEHNQRLAQALDSLLRSEPGLINIRLVLAGLYESIGETALSRILVFQTLGRISDPWALAALASIYSNRNDFGPAVVISKRAVALDTHNYLLRLYLGREYSGAGMPREAAEQAALMVQGWPKDAWALFYAGSLFSYAGHWNEALEALRRSLAAGDEAAKNGTPIDNLKWSCLSGMSEAYHGLHDYKHERLILKEMLETSHDAKVKRYVCGLLDALDTGKN